MPKETLLSTIHRLDFYVYILAILSGICSIIMLIGQSVTAFANGALAFLTFASAFLFLIFFIIRSFKSQKMPSYLSMQTMSDHKIANQYVANSITTIVVAIIISILGVIAVLHLIQMLTPIRLPFGYDSMEIIYTLGVPITIILVALTVAISPLLCNCFFNNSSTAIKQPIKYYKFTQGAIFVIITSVVVLTLLPIAPWLALFMFL